MDVLLHGVGTARFVEHWTCDQKVESLVPGRSSRRIFFFRVNLVY